MTTELPKSTDYTRFSKAQLSFNYLHTNSTTHEFIFGALAEIVDNARDAESKILKIDIEYRKDLRGENIIWFCDNGNGMGPGEVCDVIKFGKSIKRIQDEKAVGMYGNGLKSGSMRIGNDVVLITKRDEVFTVIMLSRTFLQNEGLSEIFVPMPHFQAGSTYKPFTTLNKTIDVHNQELDVILRYSPWKSKEELFHQFDRIKSETGTIVALYNLKLLDTGETELDFKSDPNDILISSVNTWSDISTTSSIATDKDDTMRYKPECISLRSYLAVLYNEITMLIYLRGKLVKSRLLVNELYKPRMYTFTSARFRVRAQKDVEEAQEELKRVENLLREVNSNVSDMNKRSLHKKPHKQLQELINKERLRSANLSDEAKQKRLLVQRLEKSVKESKVLSFTYGMKIQERYKDGIFIYNCGRLIKMYQKYRPQSELSFNYGGIVGIVDVPYQILEPTHNKQDFADAKEFKLLQKALSEGIVQYYKDMKFDTTCDIDDFWQSFGYKKGKENWTVAPDPEFEKRRSLTVPLRVQCHSCLKWRVIPFGKNNELTDEWHCKMHPNKNQANCNTKSDIPCIQNSGLLQKQKIPTIEEIDEDYRIRHRKSDHTDSPGKGTLLITNQNQKTSETSRPTSSNYVSSSKSSSANIVSMNSKRRTPRQQYDESDDSSDELGHKRKKRQKKYIESSDEDDELPEVLPVTASDKIKAMYILRKCLVYFRPPNWNKTPEELKLMGKKELANFPYKDFTHMYDKLFRKKFTDLTAAKDEKSELLLEMIDSVKDFLQVLCKRDNENFTNVTAGTENYTDEQLVKHYKDLLAQYKQQIEIQPDE